MSSEANKVLTIQNLEKALRKCIEIHYNTDDTNSVFYQLTDLAYKDSIYLCLNEGLRLDSKNPNSPKSIISLIHESYFASQLLSIRRLLDKGNDVQSLRRIFDVIYTNKSLFTRENFLIAKRDRIERRLSPDFQELEREFLNRLYDGISNTTQVTRSNDDKLYEPYLNAILHYLNRPSLIRQYTDSFIAHAILKQKHKLTISDLEKVNLANVQKLLKTISWLSFTLSRYIGELILFEVPAVTFDKFEGWTKSIFSKDIEKLLEKYWYRRVSLLKSWEDNYWDWDRFFVSPTKGFPVK